MCSKGELLGGRRRGNGGSALSHAIRKRNAQEKQRRKRYGRYDSRGRLAGKRMTGEGAH